MLTSTQINYACADFIEKLWGNPNMETNASLISPHIGACKSYSGTFNYQRQFLKTPTNDRYSIFPLNRFGISGLGGGKLPQGEWVLLANFCNDYDLLMRCRFMETQHFVDYSKTYILLTTGGTLLLATRALAKVDSELVIDVRTSELEHRAKMDTSVYTIVSEMGISNFWTMYQASVDKEFKEVILDTKYCTNLKLADIKVGSVITILHDGRVNRKLVVNLKDLTSYTLPTSQPFYLIDLDVYKTNSFYNAHDTRIYLTYNGQGILLDNFEDGGACVQVSHGHLGLSSSYVTRILTKLGWQVDNVQLCIYSTPTDQVLAGDVNYLSSFNNFSKEEQMETLTGDLMAPAILSASTLHQSYLNKLILASRWDLNSASTIYPIGYLDLLFNKSTPEATRYNNNFIDLPSNLKVKYLYKDGKIIKNEPTSSEEGNDFLELVYKKELVLYTAPTNISNFGMPAVFTETGELGTNGVNYGIAGDLISPVAGSVLVDMNSSEVLSLNINSDSYSSTVSDLSIKSKFCDISVYSDGIYLHKDIDYTIYEDSFIFWKRTLGTLEVIITPTLEKSNITTGWITNDLLAIDNTTLSESPDSYLIYLHDTLMAPSDVSWLEDYSTANVDTDLNGKPYSVVGKLLTNYTSDVQTIKDLRDTHNANLDEISTYLGRTPANQIIDNSLFSEFYYLTSPFLVDILYGMAINNIPHTDSDIAVNGLEGCIGLDIMTKYNNGYDPITFADIPSGTCVKIAPHRELDRITITPQMYTFINLVNTTYMQGRVILNEFLQMG